MQQDADRPESSTEHRLWVGGAFAVLVLSSFVFGLHSGTSGGPLSRVYASVLDSFGAVFGGGLDRRAQFLQPARSAREGVTVNLAADDAIILMSGFFEDGNEVRLISRDGEVLNRWRLSFTQLFDNSDHATVPVSHDLDIDTHGVWMEPGGDILVNFEYAGTVRLDACGGLVWALRHPTHHSISPASDGGYWIPGRVELDAVELGRMKPFHLASLYHPDEIWDDDLILKVSASGEIETSKRVSTILLDNGHEALMSATGALIDETYAWDFEVVHVNAITELTEEMAAAFPQFEPGDLLVSERNYNLLFVVSPGDWSIKWLRVGPWQRQHDPAFTPSGKILVFNNNTFNGYLGPNGHGNPDWNPVSRILEHDVATGETEVAWGAGDGEHLMSVVRGKLQPLADGGLFITEFEGGRAFQTDADGKVIWEYVNRHDDQHVGEITEAVLYPPDYLGASGLCN